MLQTSFAAVLFVIQLVFFLTFSQDVQSMYSGYILFNHHMRLFEMVLFIGLSGLFYFLFFNEINICGRGWRPQLILCGQPQVLINQKCLIEFGPINLRFKSYFIERARCFFPSFKFLPSQCSGNLFSDSESRKRYRDKIVEFAVSIIMVLMCCRLLKGVHLVLLKI